MTIRTGIGGWNYADWRGGTFFPKGLSQKRELEYASRAVAAIEVNGTFYRLQKPETFRSWREQAPEGFVFALKGSNYVTNRKVLATAEEALGRFMAQGIVELGDMLGPICWQLRATKQFDPDDLAAFFEMLPANYEGVALRHAIEVGHESFACDEFVELARRHDIAVVYSETSKRTPVAERTADFAYLRMQGMSPDCPTGYPPEDLERLKRLCEGWADGDVFAFMINGAKERAPAAAMALADLLKGRR
ncbi:DUF72 domain-containing protein [Altererythrobacter salegens]|uniref:DUF72 domain-containing protein n=1 Tax=Croceibacterium salegens TaxID=1737568 RepID=A0A6I4SQJ7_9SPHN|nr:DUF72 domain-containing protein [Croceibacterium salegens]MXO58211.1 DUF72 domain-containing protein [Croceibacterium salegens]